MFLKYEYDEWGNLWLVRFWMRTRRWHGRWLCFFFLKKMSNKGSLCCSDMGWYGLQLLRTNILDVFPLLPVSIDTRLRTRSWADRRILSRVESWDQKHPALPAHPNRSTCQAVQLGANTVRMTSPDLGFAGFAMSLFGRKCEKFDSSLYFLSSPVWKWSNHSDSSFLLPLQAALILTSDDIHSVLIASSPHQPELAVTIDILKARKAENMSRHLGDLGDSVALHGDCRISSCQTPVHGSHS